MSQIEIPKLVVGYAVGSPNDRMLVPKTIIGWCVRPKPDAAARANAQVFIRYGRLDP